MGLHSPVALHSPVVMLGILVAVVAFFGAIAAYAYDRMRFAGYRKIVLGVMKLEEMFATRAFREGNDLVVTGNRSGLPVTVRFSHSDTLPALHIRMGAPATFDLNVTPARSRTQTNKPVVRTTDEKFNMSYSLRSTQPAHAKIFLNQKRALDAVWDLCGPNTYVSIGDRAIEYGEMGVLDAGVGDRAYARIEKLLALATVLRSMPDADRVRIEPIRQVHRASLRLAIALGMMFGLALLAAAVHFWHTAAPLTVSTDRDIPIGVMPTDAVMMGDLRKWHLAIPSDYDPGIYEWAHARGVSVENHFKLDLSGSGGESASVYVLANQSGKKRVVIIAHQRNVFDSLFDSIGIVTRVPHDDINSIRWATAPLIAPPGDGLLIVRKANDAGGGTVLFFSGTRMFAGVPTNYQYMKLD
jgi:hypothetical protein